MRGVQTMKKNQTPSKKLLAIAYYFPPMGTVATIRNYTFLKELVQYFDENIILTIRNQGLTLRDNLPLNIFGKIIRIQNFDYRNFSKLLDRRSNDFTNKVNAKGNLKTVQFSRKILNSFPTNIFFGEGGLLYVVLGIIRGVKIIKRENITHIYSSFRTYSDHLIAYVLKRLFPKVYWIADFQDLHIDNYRKNVLFPKFQYWINQRLFARANVLTTVSKGFAKHLQEYNKMVAVVRFGINDLHITPENIESYEKFTIAYTGSLYETQTARPLLKAIQQLIETGQINAKKIQLIYAGKDSAIWNQWIEKFTLQDVNIDRGLVSGKEARMIQNRSHCNLLLSWTSHWIQGTTPAKVFDYLLTGKPIFFLVNGGNDTELEALLKDTNCSIFTVEKYDEIKEQVRLLYVAYCNNKLMTSKQSYEHLHIRNQVKMFIQNLEF